MLNVLQKMLYQKHNLHILNSHVQMFFIKIQPFVSSLWQKRWDKEVDNKLHAIMPQSITRDAQIENMKLLLIAFAKVIHVYRIHSEWKIDLIPLYVISVKGITS